MIARRDDLASCLNRMSRGTALRKALMNEPGPFEIPYTEPLLEAVSLFEELKIGYALAGSVAAMYYGRARYTEDLGFVAISGYMDVLAANAEVMQRHHFDPSSTWKLYHESGVQIDIWKDQHSDEIVQRAIETNLAGRNIKIAEVHDLIAMKLRAGRLQDDYDISEILRRQTIDDETVQSRVTEEQFRHFEEVKRRA